MSVTPVRFLTVADMARRLNVPRHRVVWVLAARSIRHAVELGDVHGYSEEALAAVLRELQLIDSRR